MFDTYGPYLLKAHDDEALEYFFEQIKVDNPRLENAIGVYLVAARSSGRKWIPWYVGQTWNSFGTRIVQHYRDKKFAKLIDRFGTLQFFLLPRATQKGRVRWSSSRIKSDRGLKSIDQLEFALIGTCLKLNSHLLNKSESRFHKTFYVPGFIEPTPIKPEPAARALSKLLKI